MSRTTCKILVGASAATLALGFAAPVMAQQSTVLVQQPELPPEPLDKQPANSPFRIFPLRGHVYMITGPGGNTVVSTGRDGVVVVDPSTAEAAPALLEQINRLHGGTIHAVIDTNGDMDHVGGNVVVSKAGVLLQGGNTRPAGYGDGGAPIWAHEQVQMRLTAGGTSQDGWPTDTYFTAQKDMFINSEPVQLFHVPAAHTGGDSLVMFRRSDVIAAGDVYTPDRYPVVDLANGGSINGLIDGLNMLLRLAVPEFNEEGGTLVVPGHGRIADESDLAEYRDMVTIIRDRIQSMIDKKMTLAQIKAAQPTIDYDPEFGVENGAAFTETIYKSLTAPKTPPKKTPAKGESR